METDHHVHKQVQLRMIMRVGTDCIDSEKNMAVIFDRSNCGNCGSQEEFNHSQERPQNDLPIIKPGQCHFEGGLQTPF